MFGKARFCVQLVREGEGAFLLKGKPIAVAEFDLNVRVVLSVDIGRGSLLLCPVDKVMLCGLGVAKA